MRYSQILSSFYQIYFTEQCDADDCDRYFTAASVHWKLFVISKGTEVGNSHFHRYMQHLMCMKYVVVSFAIFDLAIDPSGSGLDNPNAWCSYQTVGKPDENMFDSMPPYDFTPGQCHPSDEFLFNLPPIHLAA